MVVGRIIVLFTIVQLPLFYGCKSRENVYPEAKAQAEEYFSAAMKGDVKTAITFYDESFLKDTSAEAWAKKLSTLWQQLGNPFEYNLSSAKATVSVSGTEVVLSYAVGYSGGTGFGESPGVETLVFFKSNAGGPVKLVGHRFSNNAAQ